MTEPRFYEPSGAAPPAGILTGLGLGLVAGVILALVYAYLIVYVPIVGYVTFLFAAAFGGGVGFATAYGLRLGKVRSSGASVAVVLAVTLLAYYAEWAFWVGATFRQADFDIGVAFFVDKPGELLGAINVINEVGSWSLRSWTPTGGVLWTLWTLEAIIVVGTAVVVGVGSALARTFCERCQRWCNEEEDVLRIDDATPPDEVTNLTYARNWGALAALGAPSHPTGFYRVQLSRCPTCDDMHLLTAKHTRISIDGDGDESEETTDLVTNLFVSADDARRLQSLEPQPGGLR